MAFVAAIGLSGCTGGGDDGGGEITLTVATFGDFGYKELYRQYEDAHPGIKIQERVSDFESHHRGLAPALAAGRGAAEIVALEEQYMPQFRASKDKFANLADYGATELKSQWVPWKWEQGVTDNGSFVMGLGTDIGSLAMCYRRDLFEKAGLPTDRTQVSALWPTWEDYASTADRFSAATPDVKFADSAGNIYAAILNQADESFFSRSDDAFIADSNANLKRAFDIGGAIGAKGQTAKVSAFTQPWSVAIKQGSFATMTCPAWMLNLIKEASGEENTGKWDVATVPGNSGNWGGSFLTLPKQGRHLREAYDLAQWLTAPEQQKKVFLAAGSLPSSPKAYTDSEVLGKKDAYFSDAPVGEIFAGSADSLRPNYRGVQDAKARPKFGEALGRVEEGKQSVADAWTIAVAEARDATK
ncbi:extracellular solute-binding protein [Lentzea sp. NBRC 102530]|uniref:extracellular solute-binding protein n=1 Tax=Lentzea sp. NBRC 102530 TaxID=3032201 RepID=UPI0024A2E298|nr:extracellular solute-binding protein [Lentzea sp. NBRC 102530]GLY55152.1 sugar ABC transporter substrate-binding protein [Lentzea sp. NBRC 102530]